MTSGQFTSFPTDQIWVDRAKRQRRELTGIEDLAHSIRESGLINPPVIRRSGELVAGERRWTAVRSLGWDRIPVQFVEDLDELQLHLIEFEENVRRVDLSWEDRCRAVSDYDKLRKQIDPTWNANKTAEALGLSPAAVSQFKDVVAAIDSGNERVRSAPKLSIAKGIVQREKARAQASAIESAVETTAPETPKPVIPLLNLDFTEWVRSYDGPKFNFIHCDFPYGVGMDKSDQGSGDSFGTYADGEEVYWQLLRTLKEAMNNVVSESAHLMFWFSMDFYEHTRLLLTEMGWKVQPHPLIWHKSDNIGILPDAKRGPRRIYETAFFASRGDRLIVAPVSNVVSAPGREKAIHMNEKPVTMLRKFMSMAVDEYSSVLDPTCGSANAIKAAKTLGARTLLGIERDPNFFKLATEHFNDTGLDL